MTWSASLKVGKNEVLGTGRTQFDTVQEAETDAIKWARGHGASELFIDASEA